ncbi:MAG: hypothetical protein Q4D38_14485 [Planctomycetia bacterium]|nr:hypothetical protein [Planctomycetia bacterium]
MKRWSVCACFGALFCSWSLILAAQESYPPQSAGEADAALCLTSDDLRLLPDEPIATVAMKMSAPRAYRMVKATMKAKIPGAQTLSDFKIRLKNAGAIPSLGERLPRRAFLFVAWSKNHASFEYTSIVCTIPCPEWCWEQMAAFYASLLETKATALGDSPETQALRQTLKKQLSPVRLSAETQAYRVLPATLDPWLGGVELYVTIVGDRLILSTSRGELRDTVARYLRQGRYTQKDAAESWGVEHFASSEKLPYAFVYFDTPGAVRTFYPLAKTTAAALVLTWGERWSLLKSAYKNIPEMDEVLKHVQPIEYLWAD